MSEKKYLLVPGYIRSASDGDTHYVSPVQLKNLYNVDMHECLIYNERMMGKQPEGLIELRPSSIGNYTLPQDKEDNEAV